MSRRLLICESPGKIKKLKSILGADWNIKASMGHVVELANDGDDSLGFTLDNQNQRIICRYIPRGARGKQVLKDLREAVKQASEVFIATDPDREGETIGWHLAEQLKLKNPQRVTYAEITDKAVQAAIANPRSLDLNLIAAGRCRDTLDKLVGYKGSPLLWKLGNGAKSCGRVQSATLHILCDREREIEAFKPQEYWSIFIDYQEGFRAFYSGCASGNAVTDVDANDDATDIKEKQVESARVLSQEQAEQIVAQARSQSHQVVQLNTTTVKRKPPAPFTTSSLQQAAGSRLKFGSEKTMKVAQALYEQGHITYMRTDSVSLSEDYCREARQYLQEHDLQNVPTQVATQKSKAGAQEAHEAIRPTHANNTPESLNLKLSEEEAKLYCLIWRRALASQCQSAQLQKTQIISRSGDIFWQARGQVVTFQGYTKYWNDLSNDSSLPIVQQRQKLTLQQPGSEQKQTQPPSRYTEPKLVQMMEKRGIGRPSTYSTTCKVLREREYVSLLKGQMQPTQLGMEVDQFLMRVMPKLVDPEFTAQMEAELDAIASGNRQWEEYLINWNETYFAPALKAAYQSLGSNSKSARDADRKAAAGKIYNPRCDGVNALALPAERDRPDSKPKPRGVRPISSTQRYRVNGSLPSAPPPTNTIEHRCPVCGDLLELYEYVKDNQQKQMLRCSDAVARQRYDHKSVAFFASKGVFWSPKFGEIGNYSSGQP